VAEERGRRERAATTKTAPTWTVERREVEEEGQRGGREAGEQTSEGWTKTTKIARSHARWKIANVPGLPIPR
jgi:hypothetical protein